MKKLLFVTALLAMGTMAMGANPSSKCRIKSRGISKSSNS